MYLATIGSAPTAQTASSDRRFEGAICAEESNPTADFLRLPTPEKSANRRLAASQETAMASVNQLVMSRVRTIGIDGCRGGWVLSEANDTLASFAFSITEDL